MPFPVCLNDTDIYLSCAAVIQDYSYTNKITHECVKICPDYTIQNEYIFLYLYDDYKNRNSNFYSHIEDTEYDDTTLFTSVKVFANKVDNLSSNIEFTVFTYDTDDDFDSEGNYRGTSKYTINISNN